MAKLYKKLTGTENLKLRWFYKFKASYYIVGLNLLPEKFTLTQLRQLYDTIFQRKFDPGNFRKKILLLNVIKRLDKKDSSESKKDAFY